MPWRLILFIAIFGIFLAFIMFNMENRCDINFGFIEIEDIPVFVTIFASFAMGLVCALPLVMHLKKPRKDNPVKENKPKTYPVEAAQAASVKDYTPDDKIKQDAAEARKRFFSKRSGG